jgi:hypothetical protein
MYQVHTLCVQVHKSMHTEYKSKTLLRSGFEHSLITFIFHSSITLFIKDSMDSTVLIYSNQHFNSN